MLQNADSARTQRHANREFLLAHDIPHHQQVGEIGAGDQQDESYSAQQEPQVAASIGNHDIPKVVWVGIISPPGKVVLILRFQRSHQHAEFGPRACKRGSGSQPAYYGQVRHVVVGTDICGINPDGNPQFSGGRRKLEIRRHDPGDLAYLIVNYSRPADNVRVAMKAALPQGIAEQHCMTAAGEVLAITEVTPQHRADA